jgi:hypothetical protein
MEMYISNGKDYGMAFKTEWKWDGRDFSKPGNGGPREWYLTVLFQEVHDQVALME